MHLVLEHHSKQYAVTVMATRIYTYHSGSVFVMGCLGLRHVGPKVASKSSVLLRHSNQFVEENETHHLERIVGTSGKHLIQPEA